MKKKILVLTFGLLSAAGVAIGQHEHHGPAKKKDSTTKHSDPKKAPSRIDTTGKAEMDHQHEAMNSTEMAMPPMSHAFSRNLPMNRNGSGTGWLPDASPMYGVMLHSKKWMYMIHGNVFIRYNKQDLTNKGSRGGEKFDAPNWFMFMGQRMVGKKGLFHFSSMFSVDRLIGGGAGYPLLFQSGETWQGKPLVDRQHPHDLFSELSVSYSYALTEKSDVFVYLGYPGEPASGSVAFMHRPSSLFGPDAPISHHWNDGTHITFGVATLGFRYDKFKLEASSFNGQEPDEERYGFDKPRFNSYSSKLSFNPTNNWALQLSHGFVKSVDLSHHSDVRRTTASAIASYPLGRDRYLNITGLWGVNKTKGHAGENAALLEASVNTNKLSLSGRYEWVQKSVDNLNLDENSYGNGTLFPVNALTGGISYNILNAGPAKFAIGGQISWYHADSKLDNLYGKNPLAGQIFLRIYPKLMRTSSGT